MLPNEPHAKGGCLDPVTTLADRGVDALVAGGLGARPLAAFQEAGITVYRAGDAETVGAAAESIAAGAGQEFEPAHSCGGGGGGCGGHDHDHDHEHGGCGGHEHGHGGCGHHHEPIHREVLDEPVADGRVVLIAYRLSNDEGECLDESDSLTYFHGQGNIVPGLERALEGKVAGDSLTVTVDPKDGYGEREDERVLEVPAEQLPGGLSVGDMLHAQLPNGQGLRLVVVDLNAERGLLDANHPLAGQTLHFEVEVRQVMKPAEQDLRGGCGGGGCC